MNFFETEKKTEPVWAGKWWMQGPPEATKLPEAAELAKVSFEASFEQECHDEIVNMVSRAAKEEAAAGQYAVTVSLPGISRATRREVVHTLTDKGFECLIHANGSGNSGPSLLHVTDSSERYITVNWWPKK